MGYIYWIASYPKSGNTWVRTFLTNLILGAKDEPQINSLTDIAPDENLGRFHAPFLKVPIAEASFEQLAAARPSAQRLLAKATEGFLFLKTHSALAAQFGYPAIATDVTAGAIYVVRNPLDVVVSYSRFRNWDIDKGVQVINTPRRILPRAPQHSYVMCGSWSEHASSWTSKPHERLLVLRYEDLLSEPERHFERIPSLLGMDVSEEKVRTAVQLSAFEKLQSTEERVGFREKPRETKAFFRSGQAESWRAELSDSQVAAVTSQNEPMMRRFGYWSDDFAT
jgi:hypothetical protein